MSYRFLNYIQTHHQYKIYLFQKTKIILNAESFFCIMITWFYGIRFKFSQLIWQQKSRKK